VHKQEIAQSISAQLCDHTIHQRYRQTDGWTNVMLVRWVRKPW